MITHDAFKCVTLARELERLEKLATPGNWYQSGADPGADAEFIIALRNAFPTITRALRFAALGDKIEAALHHIAKDYQFSGAAEIALAALSKIEEARKS